MKKKIALFIAVALFAPSAFAMEITPYVGLGIVADGGIEVVDVLQAGRDGPPFLGECGSRIKFMFGSTHDGVLHVQKTVIGIDRPVGVDAVGNLGFYTAIVDFAGVHVQWSGPLARYGYDEVFAVDVEEVDAVGEPAVEQTLGEGQFVAPHRLGFQVGVLRGEHIHLADGGVAESLACTGFQFDGAGQVE